MNLVNQITFCKFTVTAARVDQKNRSRVQLKETLFTIMMNWTPVSWKPVVFLRCISQSILWLQVLCYQHNSTEPYLANDAFRKRSPAHLFFCSLLSFTDSSGWDYSLYNIYRFCGPDKVQLWFFALSWLTCGIAVAVLHYYSRLRLFI